MNRRNFLTGSATGFLVLAPPVRRPAGPSPQQPDTSRAGPADRLYDPSVVQEHPVATADDNAPEIKALEHRLKCTCGCNLDIYTCRTTDFTCTYSPALHQEVLALRSQGRDDEQIIDAFVTKYGESILMAPKPQGFNLAGYLLPGILVAMIGLVLAWMLVRRSRRLEAIRVASLAADPGTMKAPATGNVADSDRLRRALAEVED